VTSPFAAGSRLAERFAERPDRSIRRECTDHVVALGEGHLRGTLRSYARYYNESADHRSLNKDAPVHRAIERLGAIVFTADPPVDFTTDIAESDFSVYTGFRAPFSWVEI